MWGAGIEDARIGVFLCNCQGCIGDTIDLDEVSKRVRGLRNVIRIYVDDRLCSRESLRKLRRLCQAEAVDGVVVGACSPQLYLEEFRSALGHAGVKAQMIEMANLREQCAWIHSRTKRLASSKAADLVEMAVAKVLASDVSEAGCKAVVSNDVCDGCGICMSVCRLEAIRIVPDPVREGKVIATVDTEKCDGCGACVASCPSGAMDQGCVSNEQIVAQIDVATRRKGEDGDFRPNVLVFTCNWCSYAAADKAGLKRLELPPNFHVIRTMCSARVDPEWVLRAFSRGVDGVLILAGRPGECHYEVGNLRTRKRIALLRRILGQLGFREERLSLAWVNSDEPEEFRKGVAGFIDMVLDLGPNTLRSPGDRVREGASPR